MRNFFFALTIMALILPTTPLHAQAITDYWLDQKPPCGVPFTFTLQNADKIREGTTFSSRGLSFKKHNGLTYFQALEGFKVKNIPAPVRGNTIKGTVNTKSAADKPLLFFQDNGLFDPREARRGSMWGFGDPLESLAPGTPLRWPGETTSAPHDATQSICQKSTWDLGALPPTSNQIDAELELPLTSIPQKLRSIMEDNKLSDRKTIQSNTPIKEGVSVTVPYRTLAQGGGMKNETAIVILPPEVAARACERCFADKVWPDIASKLYQACTPKISCTNQQNYCAPYSDQGQSLKNKIRPEPNKAPSWIQCKNFKPIALRSVNIAPGQWKYFISFSSSCASQEVALGKGNCGGC